MVSDDQYGDALSFAKLLRDTQFSGLLSIGRFTLSGTHGVKSRIAHNQTDADLLENKHNYTFSILEGELEVSLQLYETLAEHCRLFCYTKMSGIEGMTFSINLTTSKETGDVIYLTQKIRFSEQYKGSQELAQAHRRQKQVVFCDQLKKLGYDVTENNDLILGIFDPTKKKLVNTSPQEFLNDFIVVSLLKGHFQGNKGYQLEILPSFNKLDYIFTGKDEELESLPAKVVENKSKRSIPLGMRYKVLKKDGFRCVACGNTVAGGAKLHIDHKVPYSLGGLTELNNLQTLCSDCNLSKSNKFID